MCIAYFKKVICTLEILTLTICNAFSLSGSGAITNRIPQSSSIPKNGQAVSIDTIQLIKFGKSLFSVTHLSILFK
jgi:hypothetical protein